MNLNIIWNVYKLYNVLINFKAEDLNMGWKTITGAIIMGLGYASKALAGIDPMFEIIGDALIAIGIALGGIGVRAAIAKQSTPTDTGT
jgi:hypothetical protein